MRLLLVEDDPAVRRLVADHLEQEGVDVSVATTVAAAIRELHHSEFDVAILDLTLPDGSGLDVLYELRELDSATYVTVLSGAGSEVDRVRALDLGADDYVVKPFFVRELTARIHAVKRRQDSTKATALRFGALSIDVAAREVTVDGALLHLTTKEFDLLAFMAARPRQVFSRDELLRTVWRSAADWQRDSTVTEHIRRLRSKIESDPLNPLFLRTARGAGYKFDPPPEVPSEQSPSRDWVGGRPDR
ncbi:MAG: two-component system, OmpR family, phosphate regulon response regulator OmpR [Actinomycetota bacterium]|jgi:DNA-binding response OmpR family regulator|nr:two-component system, OmpR family, phosphate regulon response regulator OmpR [Actinomycetota bacterium]MEA2843398.1 two-component system, OmpR family, phosphate regulon response regulator OmpR [Actinomycetota bacterium]